MPYLLLPLLLFSFSEVFADPFYPEHQENNQTVTESHFPKTQTFSSPCELDQSLTNIYFPLDIRKSKLIGIINSNHIFKALFLDQDNKIIGLQEGDLIMHSQIQIEKIDINNVIIIDWNESQLCHTPNRIQLRL